MKGFNKLLNVQKYENLLDFVENNNSKKLRVDPMKSSYYRVC